MDFFAAGSFESRRALSVRVGAAAVRLLRQAGLVLLGLLVWAGPAFPETDSAHTDVEFRLGLGTLCGTCEDREGFATNLNMTAQLFADRLFPIMTLGSGSLEIGPYVKGALLNGVETPQIAGGLAFGYRIGKYEVVMNGGLAYATDRIEASVNKGDQIINKSQTKHTYDLGLTLRYDIEQFFLSGGYQHNSNGTALGINFIHGKGGNPGFDNVFVGAGVRF
ncbi:MAG TPA: hypothetical protein VES96_08820 [Nitrospiraceae bacterium]|nr:hypothetical protein [Nitrospiraceae bacterium]